MIIKRIIKISTVPLVISGIIAVMLTGCGTQAPEQASRDNSQVQHIGQGSISFTFEMTDDNGAVSIWNIHTDKTTVGGALLEAGLIEGEVSSYGLMVTAVNGIRADYNEDGAYWAFYIDGDYALEGADATEIEQGKVYAFIYTKA